MLERLVGAGFKFYLGVPLESKGQTLGTICMFNRTPTELGETQVALLRAIGQQLGVAVDNSLLFAQTETALSETQALYKIIAEMNAARSFEEILTALTEQSLLKQADQLLLMAVFDRPQSESVRPEWIIPVAHRAGIPIKIAERYPVNAFEAAPNTLFTGQPVVLEDLSSDQRVDRVACTLFHTVFQAGSSVIIPLLLGEQSLGFIQGYFKDPIKVSEHEIRRLTAIAGQAAIAVQSRLLLEQATNRARQEQRIREVSSQVFSATDVDSIMRRAVEQIGKVLGVPAYIYLGDGEQSS